MLSWSLSQSLVFNVVPWLVIGPCNIGGLFDMGLHVGDVMVIVTELGV